jgi:hypothetical protein
VDRDPAEREAFVRAACASDEGLRCEVESLLGYEAVVDPWIERPAAALAAPPFDNSASPRRIRIAGRLEEPVEEASENDRA